MELARHTIEIGLEITKCVHARERVNRHGVYFWCGPVEPASQGTKGAGSTALDGSVASRDRVDRWPLNCPTAPSHVVCFPLLTGLSARRLS